MDPSFVIVNVMAKKFQFFFVVLKLQLYDVHIHCFLFSVPFRCVVHQTVVVFSVPIDLWRYGIQTASFCCHVEPKTKIIEMLLTAV